MAYDIIGNVYKVGTPETITTKNGNTITRRSLTLEQRRYDPNTGEEFNPNYPTLEFSGKACESLNNFHQGDRVRVRFDITGVRYNDKQTGEEKSLTILRGFRVEPYVSPSQSQGNGQQPQYQQQPPQPYQQQYQPQAQQQQYQPQQYQPQQQAPFPPQYDGKVPF